MDFETLNCVCKNGNFIKRQSEPSPDGKAIFIRYECTNCGRVRFLRKEI